MYVTSIYTTTLFFDILINDNSHIVNNKIKNNIYDPMNVSARFTTLTSIFDETNHGF